MSKSVGSLYAADLKRIFGSWRIYVSVILACTLLFRPLLASYNIWSRMTPLLMLSYPFGTSDFTPFAAVFCVLPFADSFCEDHACGLSTSLSLRIGARRYAFQRCIMVAFSGAMVMFFVVLIIIILCNSLAGVTETYETAEFMRDTIWGRMNVLIPFHGLFFYWGRLVLAILFGALWALVALVVSSFMTNKYVTMVAPFVLYQVLWYLLDEIPINPVYLIRADFEEIPSLGFVVAYQLFLIAVCAFLAYTGIKKKVTV